MKTFFLNLLFVFISCTLLAQQQIKCTLIDSASGKAIEFANVGILNKGIGTVSNEKGEFNLTVPDSLKKQLVKISMIGYQSKTMPAEVLEKKSKLFLTAVNFNLKEVVVSPKKNKIKIIGNDTRTKAVSAGFTSNNLGTELAVKLNIKNPNTQIRKFFVNINSKDTVNPIFRLNLYTVAKKGGPGENILKQNIIIPVKSMPSFIEVDLMPYGIYVDEDVYISIEWIKEISKGNTVMFSAKLVGSQTYYKNASQDKWEKLPSVGIGLHAEIGY
jgi:CarboxypepD_reg-like domain